MRISLSEYCHCNQREDLLAEWDSARNAPLTPDSVSYGSKRKVWWICAHGHHWQAAVHTRTGSGTGCPYCSGRLPLPGVNDLATTYPDLARQWHPTKNASLTPADVLPGSHRLVWWQCDHGHEWRAQIKSRVNGAGCPICANNLVKTGENDLASLYPELAAQWHPTKNGALTPADVVPGSRRKVWWICPKGHAYQAAISSRSSGSGCPVCAGKKIIPGENDLASQYPDIARQWHPTKNGALTPDHIAPASNKKVWWICDKGHSIRPSFPAVPSATAVVHIAQIKKCSQASTISPPFILKLQPSGTQPSTARLRPTMSFPAAAKKFGGNAAPATSGRPSSTAAPATSSAAAQSAPATPSASASTATRPCAAPQKNNRDHQPCNQQDCVNSNPSQSRY